jgi:hypothetical protein
LFTGVERIGSSGKDRRTISPCDRTDRTAIIKNKTYDTYIHKQGAIEYKVLTSSYPLWGILAMYRPVATSNKRAHPSAQAVAKYLLFQLGSISHTAPLWCSVAKNEENNQKSEKAVLSQIRLTVSADSFTSFGVPYGRVVVFSASENEVTILVVFHSGDGPFMPFQQYGLLNKKDKVVRY